MDDLTDLEQLKSGMMVESMMEIIVNMMGPAYASVQVSTNRFARFFGPVTVNKRMKRPGPGPKLVRAVCGSLDLLTELIKKLENGIC